MSILTRIRASNRVRIVSICILATGFQNMFQFTLRALEVNPDAIERIDAGEWRIAVDQLQKGDYKIWLSGVFQPCKVETDAAENDLSLYVREVGIRIGANNRSEIRIHCSSFDYFSPNPIRITRDNTSPWLTIFDDLITVLLLPISGLLMLLLYLVVLLSGLEKKRYIDLAICGTSAILYGGIYTGSFGSILPNDWNIVLIVLLRFCYAAAMFQFVFGTIPKLRLLMIPHYLAIAISAIAVVCLSVGDSATGYDVATLLWRHGLVLLSYVEIFGGLYLFVRHGHERTEVIAKGIILSAIPIFSLSIWFLFELNATTTPISSLVILSFCAIRFVKDVARLDREKALAEAARNSASELSRIAVTTLHDLKVPFAVFSTAEKHVAAADPSLSSAYKDSVDRVRELMQSFKNVFERSTQKSPTFSSLRDLKQSILKAVEASRNSMPSLTISLKLIASNSDILVRTNASELGRILQNLLKNAQEAGATNCDVSMTLVEQSLCVQVEDNGIGMNEELIRRVLDGKHRSEKDLGFGSGLHYANIQVNEWGGKLEISSNGNQTKVRIILTSRSVS